jgi:hypothetical protein
MPAQSQQQQKLFGLALSVKRGETSRSEASKEVLDIVDSMTEKQIEDFAGTSHSGLPKKVESALRELIKNAIKDNVVGDIVKEHKDCGCGCKGTTVGGCNTSLTEGLFQDIMKGVKNGSGPFTMVVIKDNKVVKQVNVNTPQSVPANYTSLEKQYPNARIRVEDSTGKIVFGESVNEENPGLWANIRAKKARGEKPAHGNSQAHKDAVKAGKKIKKSESIEEAKKGDFEMGDFVHFKSANKTGMVKRISGDKITIMTMRGDYTGDIKDIQVLYQDGVEPSVNESSVEIGDTVFLKSANKIATVIDRMGRSVTVKTGDGKKVKTVINNIKTLAQDNVNEKLDNKQLALLKYAYKDIKKINPSEPAYGRMVKHLDTLSKSELQQLADAGINFISLLAKNRLMRSESVNENFAKFDTLKMAVNQHEKGAPYYDKIRLINIFNQLSSSDQVKAKKQYRGYFGESVNEAASRTAMEIGGLTGMNKDAVQKFVDEHNLDIEKLFQYVKKGKLKERMDFVSAVVGNPGNKIQKMIIAKFGMK